MLYEVITAAAEEDSCDPHGKNPTLRPVRRWLLLLILAGCAERPGPASGPPQRVVSLLPAWTEIVVALGAGGMGVVYRARADDGEEVVAVKVLHPWLQLSARGLERFQREAEAGIAVRDPHVVRTIEAGSATAEDGSVLHYLVMEYVVV